VYVLYIVRLSYLLFLTVYDTLNFTDE